MIDKVGFPTTDYLFPVSLHLDTEILLPFNSHVTRYLANVLLVLHVDEIIDAKHLKDAVVHYVIVLPTFV